MDKALREFVKEAMTHYHVPGVAVGVLHDGAIEAAGFGVTNVDHPLEVNARTLFQIGSTSKTFCGTAAMRLVEQGKLDLDAPLRTYLPDLTLRDADVAAQVTMRHALGHAGGWVGDYFEDLSDGDDALARYVAKMAELPQQAPMKTIYSYNNAGFGLAGRVIEVVTGQPYETALQNLVLDPLGLTHTYFFAKNVITDRFAVGHINVNGTTPVVARDWQLPRTANAAGGLISDVGDQLAYARFHMGDGMAADGTRVLSAAGLAEMQRPWFTKGHEGEMGVTWHIEQVGGVRIVRHGGATVGQMSAFQMAPDRQFAITVLTNANRGVELHGAVVRWALQQYLGVAAPEPAQIPMAADALAPYAGRYAAALNEVVLTVGGDTLMMQHLPKAGLSKQATEMSLPPPPSRLTFIGDDYVMALDEPFTGNRGEFLRGPDGAIVWLRMGGRIAKRQ